MSTNPTMPNRYQSCQAHVTSNLLRLNLWRRTTKQIISIILSWTISHYQSYTVDLTSGYLIKNQIKKSNMIILIIFTSDHRIIGNTHAANVIISSRSNLAGTPCSMARIYDLNKIQAIIFLPVKPIVCVAWIWIAIIATEIITSRCVLQ